MCGNQVVTAQELIAKLNIRGFYNSETPAHLREIVRAMTNDGIDQLVLACSMRIKCRNTLTKRLKENEKIRQHSYSIPHTRAPPLAHTLLTPERQRFVSFITASTVLPPGDKQITITHVSWGPERLPLAHTCFDRLDLPEYGKRPL